MKKSDIFRNTENYYLKATDYASKELLDFALKHAGHNILDVGCATGDYCVELKKLGFNATGIDINEKYVEKSVEKGIECYLMSADDLQFPDNSFDTIILCEVLEHVKDPHNVLKEAKRVAKKNIIITVPNNTELEELGRFGLTYEHVLDEDHVNFFTKKDLESLMSEYFKEFKVEEKQPVYFELINLPRWLRVPISILYKFKIIKPHVYFRLFAIAVID